MLYALKDENQTVIAVSDSPLSEEWQLADMEDPAVIRFLQNNPEIGSQIMASSDADFIRVLEDVIDLLIKKQIIQFTELPNPVQDKLLKRRHFRETLLSDEDVTHLLDSEDTIF